MQRKNAKKPNSLFMKKEDDSVSKNSDQASNVNANEGVNYFVEGINFIWNNCCRITLYTCLLSGTVLASRAYYDHSQTTYSFSPTLGTPECEGLLLYRSNPPDLPYLSNYTTFIFGNEHTIESDNRINKCITSLAKKGDRLIIEYEERGEDSEENCNKSFEGEFKGEQIIKGKGLLCNGWDVDIELLSTYEERLSVSNLIFDSLERKKLDINDPTIERNFVKTGLQIYKAVSTDVTVTNVILKRTVDKIEKFYDESNSLQDARTKYEKYLAEEYKGETVRIKRQKSFANSIKKRSGNKSNHGSQTPNYPDISFFRCGALHVASVNEKYKKELGEGKYAQEGLDLVTDMLDKYADTNPYAILLDPGSTLLMSVLDVDNAKKIKKKLMVSNNILLAIRLPVT